MQDTSKLNNKKFVQYCYLEILSREVDKSSLKAYEKALKNHDLTREQIVFQILNSEEYQNKVKWPEFVPPGHYYSIIPSVSEVQQHLEKSEELKSRKIEAIDLNEIKQKELLKSFKKYSIERTFPDKKENKFRYYYNNPAFSYSDGFILHSFLRKFKPKRVIEVGSGFSSAIMMDTNEVFFKDKINLSFIEPFPELLFSLMKKSDRKKYQVLEERVQDVTLGKFEELESGDILFIDSTHVSKLGSDVNYLYFEVIPRLKKGVILHIHDIFWPFEYHSKWTEAGRYWNEIYILRALLIGSSMIETLFFNSYLNNFEKDWIKENIPLMQKNFGGSFWCRII